MGRVVWTSRFRGPGMATKGMLGTKPGKQRLQSCIEPLAAKARVNAQKRADGAERGRCSSSHGALVGLLAE